MFSHEFEADIKIINKLFPFTIHGRASLLLRFSNFLENKICKTYLRKKESFFFFIEVASKLLANQTPWSPSSGPMRGQQI